MPGVNASVYQVNGYIIHLFGGKCSRKTNILIVTLVPVSLLL